MLEHFRQTLQRRGITGVELTRANVLQLDELPIGWTDYDLIVSASMLEYVRRDRFVEALRALRERLGHGGSFVLFMSRRNPFARRRWPAMGIEPLHRRRAHRGVPRGWILDVPVSSVPTLGALHERVGTYR